MTFGRRSDQPSPGAASAPRPRGRRGGYWLALLGTGVALLICTVAFGLTPWFNPSGTEILSLVALALGYALPSILIVCAVVFLVVDLALKALRQTTIWLYGPINGAIAYCVFFWVQRNADPLILVGLVLIPAVIGGCILGWFRSQTSNTR